MRVSKVLVSALMCIFLFGFVTSFAAAEEVWQMTNLTIEEGDFVFVMDGELEEFPFFVRAISETEALIAQEELGLEVHGEYMIDETGWVGFIPHTFIGFPEDVIEHFFNTVDEFGVIIPEAFWFEGYINGNQATLTAEGHITMDYSIVAIFELR